MKQKALRFAFNSQSFSTAIAILCIAVLAPLNPALAQVQPVPAQSQVMTSTGANAAQAPKIPNDQLDSLVAPIALYPDPLLAQTLAASTYPLEIVQLQQWLEKNPNLKGQALLDATEKQPWDPSIQAMAAFPDVVKRLGDDIQWTTSLGNAFLDQQSDVMDAVQRMRAKAQGKGTLMTTSQQKVETQSVEGKQVIVVQQADPQVVYVPTYDPVTVYGPPVYPYPPIYYPPYGYAAGAALAFGTGIALGAAWGGGWGWGCGWGNGNVNVNVNNKYVNNWNKHNNNWNGNKGNWQHNPNHRGGTPYANNRPANRPGGGQGNRPGGGGPGNRPGGGGGGTANRPGGGGNRPGGGGTANRPGGGGNRPGGGGGTAATRPAGGGGGGNHIGNRQVSGGGGGKSNNAFGGASGGNRGSATASHNRGASSMGGRGGGGGYHGGGGGRGGGGGGRGGGGHGGGGRRR